MKLNRLTTAEELRLTQDTAREKNWKRWGPYLSERQWATVREDYSASGNCWEYFPHDHARSRAYRWGEDGLLGITDRQCRLCFALALWNSKDPILKERLFGLTGSEGNHGEDVKECYFYLDSTPTHSYMRALYKYPQAEYPYTRLIEENRRRGLSATEFELTDAGVFAEERYFDVFAEYAKGAVNDILIRILLKITAPTERRYICSRRFGFATRGHGAKSSRSARASRRLSWSRTGRAARRAWRVSARLRRERDAAFHGE